MFSCLYLILRAVKITIFCVKNHWFCGLLKLQVSACHCYTKCKNLKYYVDILNIIIIVCIIKYMYIYFLNEQIVDIVVITCRCDSHCSKKQINHRLCTGV